MNIMDNILGTRNAGSRTATCNACGKEIMVEYIRNDPKAKALCTGCYENGLVWAAIQARRQSEITSGVEEQR